MSLADFENAALDGYIEAQLKRLDELTNTPGIGEAFKTVFTDSYRRGKVVGMVQAVEFLETIEKRAPAERDRYFAGFFARSLVKLAQRVFGDERVVEIRKERAK